MHKVRGGTFSLCSVNVRRFGKEEVVKPEEVVNLHHRTIDLRSIAVFTFNYRSIGVLRNQLYALTCSISQTLFVELLRADGIAPPDPNVRMGKRKGSDEGAEDKGEEGEDSDEEGDEAQLKALMVCLPSLSVYVVDIDRGLYFLGKDE